MSRIIKKEMGISNLGDVIKLVNNNSEVLTKHVIKLERQNKLLRTSMIFGSCATLYGFWKQYKKILKLETKISKLEKGNSEEVECKEEG